MEASKGSKFYEVPLEAIERVHEILMHTPHAQNEKKKDRELTIRIEKILKQRDEAVKGADLRESPAYLLLSLFLKSFSQGKIEVAVDQLVGIALNTAKIGIEVPFHS